MQFNFGFVFAFSVRHVVFLLVFRSSHLLLVPFHLLHLITVISELGFVAINLVVIQVVGFRLSWDICLIGELLSIYLFTCLNLAKLYNGDCLVELKPLNLIISSIKERFLKL